jgi:hypothetical protein
MNQNIKNEEHEDTQTETQQCKYQTRPNFKQ